MPKDIKTDRQYVYCVLDSDGDLLLIFEKEKDAEEHAKSLTEYHSCKFTVSSEILY